MVPVQYTDIGEICKAFTVRIDRNRTAVRFAFAERYRTARCGAARVVCSKDRFIPYGAVRLVLFVSDSIRCGVVDTRTARRGSVKMEYGKNRTAS